MSNGSSIIVAFAFALITSGCASITRGLDEQVHFTSSPAEATARTSIGHTCVTPCAISVRRKDEFSVTISKAGYETREVAVKSRVSGGGAAAGILGNAVFGGLIGFTVDAASGASLDHCPNPVAVDLRRMGKHGPEGVNIMHPEERCDPGFGQPAPPLADRQ